MTAKQRKSFELGEDELAAVAKIAADRGLSVSALGREWIEDFVAVGSQYSKPAPAKMQVFVDPDILKAARTKARAEHGVSLTEIIRFNIAQQRSTQVDQAK